MDTLKQIIRSVRGFFADILWQGQGVVTLLGVVLILGLNTNLNFLHFVSAATLVQNFVTATMDAEAGVDYLLYNNEQTATYTTEADFLAGDSSEDSFETGRLDTEVLANGAVELNHYGDNPPSPAVNGAWWDDDNDPSTLYNWRYRRCFEVDYTAGTENLSEIQLYLDFDTQSLIGAGQMQSNGADIRVLNSSNQVLSHYVADDLNTPTTRVWIQVDNLNAGSQEKYCLYYGNPTAADTSDKEAVFTYDAPKDLYYVLPENANNGIIQFGSYVDNNSIIVDAYNQEFDEYELNGAQIPTVTPATEIRANAPLQVTQDGPNTDSAVPLSAAGTEFSYYLDRFEHIFDFVAPYCAATVEIYNNDSPGSPVAGGSFTVPASGNFTWDETASGNGNFANDDAYTIRSTNGCPILLFHRSTGNQDTYVALPVAEEWYGVGSNNLELSTSGAITSTTSNLTLYESNGTTKTLTLDAGNDYGSSDTGAGQGGTPPASRIVVNSGAPIGAKSIADQDGTESTTLIPRSEMDTKYILPEEAEYVTGATLAGATTTIEIYEPSTGVCEFGGGTPTATATAVSSDNRPGHFRFPTTGDGSIPAGSCIVSDQPLAPYFEKQNGDDETNLWSYKQGRPQVQNPPTVSFGTEETGTYTPSASGNTYTRRLPITVTNNAVAILEEYPVRIPLTGQTSLLTNAQTDGGDLRISGPIGDGSDTQAFYLEAFGNTFAGEGDVWTQVDIASGSSRTYYLYYDSSGSETTTSNQSAVFTYVNARPLYYPVSTYTPNQYNIYAFEPGTDLFYLGGSYSGIGPGQSYTDPGVTINVQGIVVQGEAFRANGPVNASFYRDGTEGVAPVAWAGTSFLIPETRDADTFNLLAPYGNGTVTFEKFNGGSYSPLGGTITLMQGQVVNTPRDDNNNNAPIRITSTTPILVHRVGADGANPFSGDSLTLFPPESAFEESNNRYEVYGVATSNVIIAAENPGTEVIIYDQNGTSPATNTYTLDSSNNNTVTVAGGSQGDGVGMRISADGPIFAISQADADGVEATVFLPKKDLAREFLLTIAAQYLAVVSPDASTECTLYNADDTVNTTRTLTGQTAPFVNFTVFGSTTTGATAQITEGSYLLCTDPVYAMYEKQGDSSNPDITDETNFLSFPQARKYLPPEVVVADVDDPESNEEGLYFESGFAGTSPTATLELTFDAFAAGSSFPQDVFYQLLEWSQNVPTQTTQNGITPVTFTLAAGPGPDCTTATYAGTTAFTASPSNLDPNLADNQCLRLTLNLQTGDPAYTPQLESVNLTYLEPILLTPTNQEIVLSSTNPTANDVRRLVKVTTANPNLTNLNHELSFVGVTGGDVSQFSEFDLSLRDVSTATDYVQFNFPPFPATPPEIISGSSAPLSVTAPNTVILEQSFGNNLGEPVVELSSTLYLNGSDSAYLTRAFQVRYVE